MRTSNKGLKILGAKGETIGTIQIDVPRSHFIKDYKYPTELALVFKEVKPMFKYLGYSQNEVAEVLEVNPSTLNRWEKNEKDNTIGKLRSKTITDIDHIIAKGVRIFGTEENLKSWLNTANYALGNAKPIEFLKDPFKIELVDNAIEAMSWGNVI